MEAAARGGQSFGRLFSVGESRAVLVIFRRQQSAVEEAVIFPHFDGLGKAMQRGTLTHLGWKNKKVHCVTLCCLYTISVINQIKNRTPFSLIFAQNHAT